MWHVIMMRIKHSSKSDAPPKLRFMSARRSKNSKWSLLGGEGELLNKVRIAEFQFLADPLRRSTVSPGMIKVFNKDTNELLGRISEEDLQFLQDQLEEESLDDHDYYMTRETIEGFASAGASQSLNSLLEGAIRNEKAIEIRWERDPATKLT